MRNCTEHYGNTFCVYNVHGLVHITDDVECKSKINTKVTIKPKDNCFFIKKRIVFIHNIHSDGTYDCSFYSKDVLEGFSNNFLDSMELNIFYIKGNIRPVKCTKKVTDLLRKCCCLPYKYGHVIVPLVTYVKGPDSTQ